MKYTLILAFLATCASAAPAIRGANVARAGDLFMVDDDAPAEPLPNRPHSPGRVSGLVDRAGDLFMEDDDTPAKPWPNRPHSPGRVSTYLPKRQAVQAPPSNYISAPLALRGQNDMASRDYDTKKDIQKLGVYNVPAGGGLVDRGSNLPPLEDFREPDYQERVSGFDRLNEAERLRQVAAMKAENPTMKVRQNDIDRFTEHMIPDALTGTVDDFCAIVVKIGLSELELKQEPKEDWFPMCAAKYKEYNDLYSEYKHDHDAWEAHMERVWEKTLDFTHVDWVRIANEDREQTEREASEAAARLQFAELMDEIRDSPSVDKRSEDDEDRPLEPKLSRWTKFKNDMSSLIGIDF